MNFNPFRRGGNQSTQENGNGHVTDVIRAESLETEFQRLKTNIHRELLDTLDLSRIAQLTDDELRADIRRIAEGILRLRALDDTVDEERLIDELVAESFGLGPLEPYMHDPDVSDILVNGAYEVFVERLGQLQETNTVFADDEHLMQIISRIAARVGRRIDENSPMVDARLPDGSRVNAIIPPLALGGPVLSIRRFGVRPLQIGDLLTRGSICPEMIQFLEATVEGRINMMISGGTGSGKTTLLNNVSRFIPNGERIVTIEDSAELILQRKHVVKLETRPASAEGTGAVTQRDLVKNSLRMRPDRILLGEVRGAEALDMLQAMNTGHEGSITTIHANDTDDALTRLEVMVSMNGAEMPVMVVRRYIASAITIVVHLARLKGGARRVMRVSEICGLENGEYAMHEIFGYKQCGFDANGMTQGYFYSTGYEPAINERLKDVGINLPSNLFQERQLTAIEAARTISRADELDAQDRADSNEENDA
ncbi:MAG: pilus assembly protein CpaF [Pirellulaceae bacterium]|jgi:pilus assembly protein CpaF